MLEAYCREIDASSFLPEAAMLITCVKAAKEPPDSIREIIEKVKGRLKFIRSQRSWTRFSPEVDLPMQSIHVLVFSRGRFCSATAAGSNPPSAPGFIPRPIRRIPGGLKGRIAKPGAPIEQILATPTANPEKRLSGRNHRPQEGHLSLQRPAGRQIRSYRDLPGRLL